MSSDPTSEQASENTPLLSRDDEESSYTHANGEASTSIRPLQDGPPKGGRRWATIIALSLLSLSVLAILGLGFAAPAIVEQYAKEALIFEPTSLSLDSLTGDGVIARVQGIFFLDAKRVHKKAVRDLGKVGTWIAREVESDSSSVKVYLPEYQNLLLGTAEVPPMKVNIRNGHYNHVDFLTELKPGDVKGARRVATDWLDGNLGRLNVKAVASIPLRSGLIRLGTQVVKQEIQFEGNDIPSMPDFDIEKLKFDEYGPPGKPEGVRASARIALMNDYPVKFDVPPLRFQVMVPDCHDGYLTLGDAQTEVAHILPKQFVKVDVTGMIRQLPSDLTTACPGHRPSPLDVILAEYLKGKKTTVYVKGGQQDVRTPDWISQLIRDTTVPIPLPGHPFDNLIRNFSLADVHFSLPGPFADPDTPESKPTITATVKALVGLPKEMNFNLAVDRVRADADVFYKGEKLGFLDLHKWQPARTNKTKEGLLIESDVEKAPLDITDEDVFTSVVNELIFSGKGIVLEVEAKVDVNTVTALGEFVVREIPASGKIYVKPLTGGFESKIGDLQILETTTNAITFSAMVNLTNPTEYSAKIPYINISVASNSSELGFASAQDIDVVTGLNIIQVMSTLVGGKEFISHYLSGDNTTLTLRSHAGTIPSAPRLGKALSGLEVEIPTPKLFGKFIKDATMHLISSTATFILISPFKLSITNISATAIYNGTEVGTLDYDYPFDVPVGASETPKLPVVWNYDSGVVRDALGGTLKLDTKADVGVKIGNWHQQVWYEGTGIGAKVRL